MPENTEQNQSAEREAVFANLAEALSEAEDMAAEFASEMLAEAHQAWRQVLRLSKE